MDYLQINSIIEAEPQPRPPGHFTPLSVVGSICSLVLFIFDLTGFIFVLYLYFGLLRKKTDQFNGFAIICLELALVIRGSCNAANEFMGKN